VCIGGCATLPQGKHDPRDPFERFNRAVWTFDNTLDHVILRPALREYSSTTPSPVSRSIRNFFSNATYTDTIVNDLLQAKFANGANDLARLVVNSVVGLGGLFDPATRMGLARHHADFGQTLGVWGLPSGPYLMLPLLGPSDLRDFFGQAADEYLTPPAYSHDPYLRWGFYAVDQAIERAQYMGLNRLIDKAFDPYAFVRNAYLDHREFLIHGGRDKSIELELPEAVEGTSDPGMSP
jgi:phospholipid-binding lipoprotein MlaA